MLKQAVLVLLPLVFVGLQANGNSFQDSIPAETVSIKVTVLPRIDLSELKTEIEPSDHKSKPRRSPEKTESLSVPNKDQDKPRAFTDSSGTDIISSVIPKPEGVKQDNTANAFAEKKLYFFSGLLMLIAGIILTLFFRTGKSLMIGIILIVSGFYVLLYSLLFIGII